MKIITLVFIILLAGCDDPIDNFLDGKKIYTEDGCVFQEFGMSRNSTGFYFLWDQSSKDCQFNRSTNAEKERD